MVRYPLFLIACILILFSCVYKTYAADNMDKFTKWQGVIADQGLPEPLAQLLDKQRNLAELAKITYVNDVVNDMVTYRPDEPGKDYWQTPSKTYYRDTGDCEDFAIMKFFMLKYYGIPAKLLIVWNVEAQEHHMVVETQYMTLDYRDPPTIPYIKIYALTETTWESFQ